MVKVRLNGEEKTSEAKPSNSISERLTGRKPVRNEVTSQRVYCQIISVGRAIASSYWYCPQYTILLSRMQITRPSLSPVVFGTRLSDFAPCNHACHSQGIVVKNNNLPERQPASDVLVNYVLLLLPQLCDGLLFLFSCRA